jgi:hypothetical protein
LSLYYAHTYGENIFSVASEEIFWDSVRASKELCKMRFTVLYQSRAIINYMVSFDIEKSEIVEVSL